MEVMPSCAYQSWQTATYSTTSTCSTLLPAHSQGRGTIMTIIGWIDIEEHLDVRHCKLVIIETMCRSLSLSVPFDKKRHPLLQIHIKDSHQQVPHKNIQCVSDCWLHCLRSPMLGLCTVTTLGVSQDIMLASILTLEYLK